MKNNTKIVFVTGGSRGIGKGIVAHFVSQGYRVGIGFLTNQVLLENPIQTDNQFSVQLDIANRSDIQKAIKETESYFNSDSIDILVNNAGIAQEKPFETILDDDWDKMLATNLRGAFSFSHEVIPKMVAKKWGRIINVTSIGGQWGGYNQVHYAASKAGLISLTQSIAKIYSKHHITCNAISPGLVQTDMASNELETKAGREKVKNIPAGRIGTIEEMAAAVGFLASEEASYITGQTINLNGGMYFG